MKAENAYENLLKRSREATLLSSTAVLLVWDQERFMPESGIDWRAEQMAWLAGLKHRLATAPEIGDWLAACEDAGLLSDEARGPNVREWRRDYDREVKLPLELVEE